VAVARLDQWYNLALLTPEVEVLVVPAQDKVVLLVVLVLFYWQYQLLITQVVLRVLQ
jgi:hypothetical protein